MGQLVLTCAGQPFNSGFRITRDELRSMPPDQQTRLHCRICGHVHEFTLAMGRVCECPHNCPTYVKCQLCELGTAQQVEQRRKSPRRRTLMSGKIVFNKKSSVIDCTVCNLSAEGACLRLAGVASLPDQFDLLIDGTLRPAKLIWRSYRQVGIFFLNVGEKIAIRKPHVGNDPVKDRIW
jgi:hypothetical protein